MTETMHPHAESRRLMEVFRAEKLPVLRVSHLEGTLWVHMPSRWNLRHRRPNTQSAFCDPDCPGCRRHQETERRIRETVERVTGRQGGMDGPFIKEEPRRFQRRAISVPDR